MESAKGWTLGVGLSLLLATTGFAASMDVKLPGEQGSLQLELAEANLVSQGSELRLDGLVEAVNRAQVSAQTSGRILELPFEIGDSVTAGQVIARLTQSEQQAGVSAAQAQLREAQTAFEEADRQWRRLQALFDQKLVAKAPVDNGRQVRDAAAARVESAKAVLEDATARLEYTEVVAPYSGIVVQRLVSEGEAVLPGTPLLEGIALDQLRVRVQVPQTYVSAVQRVKTSDLLLDSGERIPLTVSRFVPQANQSNHSFTWLFDLPELPNQSGVLPGTFARLAFQIDEKLRLMVPDDAIARRGEITAVYVKPADSDQLEFRYVRVGQTDQLGMTEVVSGLTQGEQIVVDPVAGAVAYKEQNRVSQ